MMGKLTLRIERFASHKYQKVADEVSNNKAEQTTPVAAIAAFFPIVARLHRKALGALRDGNTLCV